MSDTTCSRLKRMFLEKLDICLNLKYDPHNLLLFRVDRSLDTTLIPIFWWMYKLKL